MKKKRVGRAGSASKAKLAAAPASSPAAASPSRGSATSKRRKKKAAEEDDTGGWVVDGDSDDEGDVFAFSQVRPEWVVSNVGEGGSGSKKKAAAEGEEENDEEEEQRRNEIALSQFGPTEIDLAGSKKDKAAREKVSKEIYEEKVGDMTQRNTVATARRA